jgi:hypothetical protein
MYKIFQSGEKMKLPLPHGETLNPGAESRRGRERSENLPEFCLELGRRVDQAGTSQNDFASLMSGQTGMEISPARLSSWLRGVVPKNTKKNPDMVENLLKAAAVVAERGGSAPPKVDATTVSRQIKAWLAEGRSRRQIQLAGELSQATLSSWELGLIDVAHPKWERVKLMVEKLFAILDIEEKLKELGVEVNIPGFQSISEDTGTSLDSPPPGERTGEETSPVPKKRGRPRKHPVAGVAEPSPVNQSPSQAGSAQPVKRGRGRPRKHPLPTA